MDEQLPGCLGDIEAVLKELVDRCQCLLIEFFGILALEDLSDEHLAQRDRQLIDQPADSEFVVRDHRAVFKEDLADVQRHLGLFVGAAHFLDLAHYSAVGDARSGYAQFLQVRVDRVRGLLDVLDPASVREVLDHHDIALIHRCHKIRRRCADEFLHDFKNVSVALKACLYDHDDPLGVRCDVQFLGAAVNIDQQQVVKEQVLHEAVLVIALFKSAHQSLELERRHAADQKRAVRLAVDDDDILELLLVHNFEELIRSRRLTIRRRISKIRDRRSCICKYRCRNCYFSPVGIHDSEFEMRYFFYTFYSIL